MAAVLWGGAGACISHLAAASLWQLDGVEGLRLEITIPSTRRLRSQSIFVHRTTRLDPLDHTVLHRIPVTSVDRTLIDASASLAPFRLELAVEDAFRRRLTDPRQLGERLSALEGKGRAGSTRLRALLDERGERVASGSAAEVRLERLLVRNGLPRPVRQFHVTHGDHTIRVDLAYPDRRLAIEFDSVRWHTGRSKLDRDADRRNLLRAAAWELVTVTDTMLRRRPMQTVATVARAYADGASFSKDGNGQGVAGNVQ